jgi:uncharacterized protein
MSLMRLRRSRIRPWLKKVPRQRHVRGTWLHRLLGERLFSPDLWRPSRSTVALGAATGLFWAMMPIPFQMLPSAITAYFCRFNVPSAISVVWITNPFTWPLILYWQYLLGAFLLRQPPSDDMTQESLMEMAAGVPGPLLLGCVVSGLFFGAGAYAVVNSLWGVVAERWWRSHERPRVRAVEKP